MPFTKHSQLTTRSQKPWNSNANSSLHTDTICPQITCMCDVIVYYICGIGEPWTCIKTQNLIQFLREVHTISSFSLPSDTRPIGTLSNWHEFSIAWIIIYVHSNWGMFSPSWNQKNSNWCALHLALSIPIKVHRVMEEAGSSWTLKARQLSQLLRGTRSDETHIVELLQQLNEFSYPVQGLAPQVLC